MWSPPIPLSCQNVIFRSSQAIRKKIDLAFASCIWCFDISPQEGKLFLRGRQSVVQGLFIDTSKVVTKGFLKNHAGRSFIPFPALGAGFDLLSLLVHACQMLTVEPVAHFSRCTGPQKCTS